MQQRATPPGTWRGPSTSSDFSAFLELLNANNAEGTKLAIDWEADTAIEESVLCSIGNPRLKPTFQCVAEIQRCLFRSPAAVIAPSAEMLECRVRVPGAVCVLANLLCPSEHAQTGVERAAILCSALIL